MLLKGAKFDYDQIKKMLSGTEIFNFFVSDLLDPISAGGGGGWNPPPSRFFHRHSHKNQPMDSKLSDF